MTTDQLGAALQAEYLHLQKTIEDFDARALTIKAWSVTASLAGVGAAFASHSPLVFAVAALSAACFWILEIQWKLFQAAYYSRAKQLERHFRNGGQLEHPFQIAESWSESFREARFQKALRIAVWPHVALPHLIVVAVGLVLFVCVKP